MNTPSTIRIALLAGIPPLLSAVPNIVLLAAAADRLPDPIATHFGSDGADGFTGRVPTMVISAGLGLGLAVLFAAILAVGFRQGRMVRRPDSTVDPSRLLFGTAWGVGGFVGMLMLFSTVANLDIADPAQVTLPGWTFVVAAAVGVLFGGAGWLAAPESPIAAEPSRVVRPLPIGATERVNWSRRITAPWMLLTGVVSALIGMTLGIVAQPFAGVVLVLTGALVAHLALVRVVVDRRGLTVGTGLAGWPRWRLEPQEITEVSTADISPAHYGGYGIRLIPGTTAVVLRGGPGIVVTRRSGRRFAVSVDDAETGAGVLAGVVHRSA
ncbi:DUF1648 domain-containing protein [Nocardia sp. NPDC019395]|uniref:DUF1648 domain-containing protein n=1 Tax=Nocardia sp. NPDC019395 TaxID=3154686 RepID=UPI003404BCC9